MNNKEILNTASAVGTYNGLPTEITSEAVAVQMIDGLTITKTADKQSWGNGLLTYTITIQNVATESYGAPVVTDVIDTTLVKFVSDSVYIDDTKAESTQYTYDDTTHTLTINLTDIPASGSKKITFQVSKA